MKQLLEGIRVIDWTLQVAGPCAAGILADNGAEVIHLEEKDHGDALRGVETINGTYLMLPDGKQSFFESLNRNKKGLAVDLKRPEGREIISRLIDQSDVFITSFRPQARKRVGLDYEAVKQRNPRIIYGSNTAYGELGPMAQAPGVELVGYAQAGSMLGSGEEGTAPIYFTPGLGDCAAAYCLAYGVMSALFGRERFGGQEIKTSLLGAMVALQRPAVVNHLLTGREVARHNRKTDPNPLWNWYQCKDGQWVCFAEPRDKWSAFSDAIGLPWLKTDSRFADRVSRIKHCVEVIAIIEAELVKRDAAEWVRIFERIDLCCARVKTVGELATDPQVLANDYIVEWEHPDIGKRWDVGSPISWSETPPQFHSPAPNIGQHTEEILVDTLGYSWDDVIALKASDVIL